MVLFNDKSECCGCGACANICPVSAIDMVCDDEGFEFPQTNKERCMGCELCLKVCPLKSSQNSKAEESNKKHIGIINLQNTNNYGAVIAAAVLEDVVRNTAGSGYVVNTVNYTPLKAFSNRIFRMRDEIKQWGGLKNYINARLSKGIDMQTSLVRSQRFAIFKDTFLNITPNYSKAENINKNINYSAFITGSDIVWGPKRTDDFRSEGYYLKFADKGEKRIAFAPSIDNKVDKKLRKLSDIYKENLKHLDFISVREKSNLEFVQSLTDKKVYHCYDPAFLVDQQYYDEMIDIAQVEEKNEKFIYVYILEKNQPIVDYANKLAKKKNLKIYYFSANHNEYVNTAVNCASDGPAEFLYRLKNAEYVLTNSFHCVVFSLIFKKQFLSFCRSDVSIKATDLLDEFNLNDRLYENNSDIDSVIDFSKVDEKLRSVKKQSLDYLKMALDSID